MPSLKGGPSRWHFTQEKDYLNLHNYEAHERISSKINVMVLYILKLLLVSQKCRVFLCLVHV